MHPTPVLVMEEHQGKRGHLPKAIDTLPEEVQEWVSDQEFHSMDSICIGARVMCTDNCKKIKGYVNGGMGTVVKVEVKDSVVVRIHVLMDANNTITPSLCLRIVMALHVASLQPPG